MENTAENDMPFSMMVGLKDAKLALILTIIDPKIGGVLIAGPKGTGKSTLVRSLKNILPEIHYVSDCTFKCNPLKTKNMCEKCRKKSIEQKTELKIKKKKMEIITLPLGATEDRVIGSIDIEKIIEEGIEALAPGILAKANQEILYIDEINLLPDHLVDTILDSAASGWNIIERENISVKHPSQFILIGTMNPEEGDLRPQLLDRLSLYAHAENIQNLPERIKIIELNIKEGGEEEWKKITTHYRKKDIEIKEKIIQARKKLDKIEITQKMKKIIAELCMGLKVDGFRSDIVLARSIRAKAAYENRNEITTEDIIQCAPLTLLHRTREGGMREPPSRTEINRLIAKIIPKKKEK